MTVLQKDEPAVAAATVAALPAEQVPRLLQRLSAAAAARTPTCGAACTWAAAVLRAHAALLLAASSSSSPAALQLAVLLAHFTRRYLPPFS
jgi:hypothetical protein